ncbi:predicted protein [Postia placenta Mad-698-R]|nr:predicted protein [Postia placenta Mad-698-R]
MFSSRIRSLEGLLNAYAGVICVFILEKCERSPVMCFTTCVYEQKARNPDAVTSMADTPGSIALEMIHAHDVSTSAWGTELSADACPSEIQSARDAVPSSASHYPFHLARHAEGSADIGTASLFAYDVTVHLRGIDKRRHLASMVDFASRSEEDTDKDELGEGRNDATKMAAAFFPALDDRAAHELNNYKVQPTLGTLAAQEGIFRNVRLTAHFHLLARSPGQKPRTEWTTREAEERAARVPSVATTVRTARGAFVHGRSDARKGKSRVVHTSRAVVIYYDRGLRPPATRAPELASSFLNACLNIIGNTSAGNNKSMFEDTMVLSPLSSMLASTAIFTPAKRPAASRVRTRKWEIMTHNNWEIMAHNKWEIMAHDFSSATIHVQRATKHEQDGIIEGWQDTQSRAFWEILRTRTWLVLAVDFATSHPVPHVPSRSGILSGERQWANARENRRPSPISQALFVFQNAVDEMTGLCNRVTLSIFALTLGQSCLELEYNGEHSMTGGDDEWRGEVTNIPSTASAEVRLLLSKAIIRAPLPMPSTRPGAHIGADKAPSMVLLEMFWLVAEVFGEVQIVSVVMMNVVDKTTTTAILGLNTSRAPRQSGERNMSVPTTGNRRAAVERIRPDGQHHYAQEDDSLVQDVSQLEDPGDAAVR